MSNNPIQKSFEFYATVQPAGLAGCDFYDCFMAGKNTLVLIMADVSDRGLPAAMRMLAVKNLFRGLMVSGRDPAEAMSIANSILSADDSEMYAAVWLALIDLATGRGVFCNAGFPFPMIRRGTETIVLKQNPEPFVGASEKHRYREHGFGMKADDELVIFSDGIVCAENMSHELYGAGRLIAKLDVCGHNAKNICKDLLGGVSGFTGDAGQRDDRTVLAFRLLELAEDVPSAAHLMESHQAVYRTFQAGQENVSGVIDWIENYLVDACCPEEVRRNIGVAVDDAVNNIVDYAYPEGGGSVSASLSLGERSASICFTDNGIPFNPLSSEVTNVKAASEKGGLGIFLIRSLMDKVLYEYAENANRLTLVKSW